MKSEGKEGKLDFLALVLDSVLGREATSLASDGGGWGGAAKLRMGAGGVVALLFYGLKWYVV